MSVREDPPGLTSTRPSLTGPTRPGLDRGWLDRGWLDRGWLARGWLGAAGVGVGFGLTVIIALTVVGNDTPVDHGWLLITVLTVAGLGLSASLLGRSPRWLGTWGVGAAGAAAGAVTLSAWWLRRSSLDVGHYPPSFLAWGWGGFFAVALALVGWRSGPGAVRIARVLTAPVALLASFLLINSHYGYWPNVGALLGRPVVGEISGRSLASELTHPPPAGPAAARPGAPPARLPPGDAGHRLRLATDEGPGPGQYGPVAIPGGAVGFAAAQAYVWLPPDFASVAHAHLPVLLMLPGWPGEVQDWVLAGQALKVANAWALGHGGAAPVMVFVDENGAAGHDTECVNGPQGNAESYLSSVVPAYIHHVLGIDADPNRWATVGFSEGGTCALGLAVEHPEIFGRFVDIAGDLAPNYGTTAKDTLKDLYGGSRTVEGAHDPLGILAQRTFPDTVGWLTAGRGDVGHSQVVARLSMATRAAGVRTVAWIGGGGHSWHYAGRALTTTYPALVASLGNTLPTPSSPLETEATHRLAIPAAHHVEHGSRAPLRHL